EEFVRLFSVRCRRLLDAYTERADRAYLLRYEDLILEPVTSLSRLLGYLGLPADEQLVRRMVEAPQKREGPLAAHRTTDDPRSSIGRWRRDLDSSMQQACELWLGDILRDFGYQDVGHEE